jgi:hypothetical protein
VSISTVPEKQRGLTLPFTEGSRQMMSALQNAQRFRARYRRASKSLPFKIRMQEGDIVNQAFDGFPIQQVAERATFTN